MPRQRTSLSGQEVIDPILDVVPDLSRYLKPPVQRIVCVRYFLTITPPSEGSLVKWFDPPARFTGEELKQALEEKGLSFVHHRPQVYDKGLRRFLMLGDGDVLRVPPEQGWLFLNLRLVPRVPDHIMHATGGSPTTEGAEQAGGGNHHGANTTNAGAQHEPKRKHLISAEGLLHVAAKAKRLLNRRAFSMDDLVSAEDEVVLYEEDDGSDSEGGIRRRGTSDPRTPLVSSTPSPTRARRQSTGGRRKSSHS